VASTTLAACRSSLELCLTPLTAFLLSMPPQLTYILLQSVVLLLLMVRLVSHITFQPRLAIISKTLALSAAGG
jgi:hypothetical protein